jgi:hypothetical protein
MEMDGWIIWKEGRRSKEEEEEEEGGLCVTG